MDRIEKHVNICKKSNVVPHKKTASNTPRQVEEAPKPSPAPKASKSQPSKHLSAPTESKQVANGTGGSGAKFCSECGQKFEQVAKFCTECGAKR